MGIRDGWKMDDYSLSQGAPRELPAAVSKFRGDDKDTKHFVA
jgi:hypothetical protein